MKLQESRQQSINFLGLVGLVIFLSDLCLLMIARMSLRHTNFMVATRRALQRKRGFSKILVRSEGLLFIHSGEASMATKNTAATAMIEANFTCNILR